MYKEKIYILMLSLLCLMTSSAVWADDDIAQNVSPTLTNNDEVCIFLQSPDNATFNFWGSGSESDGDNAYQRQDGLTAPGDQFTLVGRQADGLYLYKWVRPAGAKNIPSHVIIYKNYESEAQPGKVFDGNYSNHGVYMEEKVSQTTDELRFDRDLSVNTDPALGSPTEHTIYLETPNEQDYFMWPWNDNYSDGGAHFTVKLDASGNYQKDENGNYIAGGSYPGDKLTEIKRLDNGNYLYKWTQVVNTNDTAAAFILSKGKNDADKINPNSTAYKSGYYTEVITVLSQVSHVYQYTTAHTAITPATTSLDPMAKLDAADEVSVFLESPRDETYHVWVWDDTDHPNGEDFTPEGTAYPGPTFTKVGQLPNKNYLYKWTENPSLHITPTHLIINKGDGDDNKLFNDKDGISFTNHGYYLVTVGDDGKETAAYHDVVIRQSSGSYATSRTTYGQRVIYELNVGSFTPAGTFAAAKNQLTYLHDLGVDVIWLMPVYQRDKGASPYAVKDYMNVNSSYGTLADLKDFVTSAHLMGMDVWLDFVANHAATNNIWAVEDVDSEGKPQNNYHPEYFSKGADGKFVHPSSGSITYNDVWQFDYNKQVDAEGNEVTDPSSTVETYNPITRQMLEVLKYWVDQTDIDGYRFDMVSSTTIPDAFWDAATTYLKTVKPSIQFLAEKDFAQDHNVNPSYFQYDYAWDFNSDLRNFGKSTYAWNNTDNDLLSITKRRIDDFNKSNVDPMVYLTNHDVNWNDNPKTLNGTWGANRYPMTVYEFTMPGMPLIYNGQEQDGTVALDYFNETKIDWANTRDYRMLGLIKELTYLKHTNNALNDGYTKDMRGDTWLLNAFTTNDNIAEENQHAVMAYERVKGDKHVLVVLNLSNVVLSPRILGATKGKWTKVLEGSGSDLETPYTATDISDVWDCVNVPANGYQIYTYTGPKRAQASEGLYFVADDSWDTPTMHKMVKNSNGTYTFTLEASDYDAMNPLPDNYKAGDSNPFYFKLQQFYDWKGTSIRTDQMLGAYDVSNAIFSETATSFTAKKDGSIDKDDPEDQTKKKNNYKFQLAKGGDDVLRYIFTFTPTSNMDEGTLSMQVIHKGDMLDGWYLLTPSNIEGDLGDKLKWRFKYEAEDPDAVDDSYLKYRIKDEKEQLASFTIDADLFDKYMPDDRAASNSIQFRIGRVLNGQQNMKDGNITEVQPAKDSAYDDSPDTHTFDEDKDPNKWYQNAWWETFNPEKEYYFTLRKKDNVDKYIIQVWTNNSYTSVKVRYVLRFDYKGSDINDVAASNEDVYLYNVDAHRFLYTGNVWGTMASLLYKDLGTRLNISEGVTGDNPDFKMIRTKFENNTTVTNGHMLGIDDFSYREIANPQSDNDRFLNLDSANIFCDRDNGNKWIIEKVDTVNYANTYTLSLYNNKDGRYHVMQAAHDDTGKNPNKNTEVIYVAQRVNNIEVRDLTNDNIKGNARKHGNDYIGNLGEGKGNYITYTYHAPKAGTYQLDIKYLSRINYNNPARNLTVSVGDSTIVKVAGDATNWTNPRYAKTLSYSFPMKAGDNVITIGSQGTGNGDDPAPNFAGFSIRLVRPADLKYARWQFVTYRDLMEKLRSDNAEVYGGTHADATFLMKDQGFTRYIQNTWDNDRGKSDSYNITYTSQKDKADKSLPTSYSSSESSVTLTKNKIGDNRDYGMYWNGHINGKGLVYQDVDVPVYGVYQFDAYGFCHGSTTKMFYQYAKSFNADGSVKEWSNMYVGQPLKHNDKGYDATLKNNGKDNSKQNDIDTGREFYNESVLETSNKTYLNTQFAYIPENADHSASNNGNYRLRIGFFKTADDVDNGDADKDYTAVDDVHLHYNGKSPFTLYDSWDKQTLNDKSTNETRQSVPVWLKRKFTLDVWNTVVLPLPVSISTLQDIFGPDVVVASPYGLDDNDPYLIRFNQVDLTNVNGGIALEAGKYYIVKPKKLNGNTSVINVDNTTGEVLEDGIQESDAEGTAFYYLGNFDLRDGTANKTNLTSDCAELKVASGFHGSSKNHPEHNSIKFVGSYSAVYITATSKTDQADGLYRYVFNANTGHMVRLTNPNRQRLMTGYKFYIEDYNGNSQGAKQYGMVIGSLDDDLSDILDSYNRRSEPTGIKDVNGHGGSDGSHGDGFVYDLSGRRVAEGGKVDALPRGVYILNGKKFIKE